MSGFPALEAVSLFDAFFSFFWGEFFNSDRVNIHGIGINFRVLVIGGVVLLHRVWVVGFFVGNGVCPDPLGFEVDDSGVPVVNFGGDCVHAIDLLH